MTATPGAVVGRALRAAAAVREVGMATATDRPRILAALFDLTWQAGRMACVDEEYAGVHESINRWLDELERCG